LTGTVWLERFPPSEIAPGQSAEYRFYDDMFWGHQGRRPKSQLTQRKQGSGPALRSVANSLHTHRLIAACMSFLSDAVRSAYLSSGAALDGWHVLRQPSRAATCLGSIWKWRSGALETQGEGAVVPRGSWLLSATADSVILDNNPNAPGARRPSCQTIRGCGFASRSRCLHKLRPTPCHSAPIRGRRLDWRTTKQRLDTLPRLPWAP
jgi:hypothetical protein